MRLSEPLLPHHARERGAVLAEEEATYKILAGTLFYPLCWTAEGGAAWALGGGWALGRLLAALFPTGFFALGWHERLTRVTREARAFVRFLVDRDLRGQLMARRQALIDELTAFADLVVESADASPDPRRS